MSFRTRTLKLGRKPLSAADWTQRWPGHA